MAFVFNVATNSWSFWDWGANTGDYVNAKRRKQRGRRELDPNADSFYFCNENFRMEFITQREFLGRIAAQIATLSSSIVVAATATPVPPPTAELEPFKLQVEGAAAAALATLESL